MVKTRNSVENGESLGDILSSDTRRGPNVRSKRRPVGSRPNRRGIVYHDNVNVSHSYDNHTLKSQH